MLNSRNMNGGSNALNEHANGDWDHWAHSRVGAAKPSGTLMFQFWQPLTSTAMQQICASVSALEFRCGAVEPTYERCAALQYEPNGPIDHDNMFACYAAANAARMAQKKARLQQGDCLHVCDFPGCTYQTDFITNYKRHQLTHVPAAEWVFEYVCDAPGCTY